MQTIQTRLKEFWERIKNFFNKLNKRIRILLGVCLVVLVAVIIAVAVKMNQKEYTVLFTGLTSSETSTIISFLNENGVTDYRIQGDSILVQEGREQQLQRQLILSGQLNSGFLYPYYTEHAGTLSTSEEQKRAWLVSIQERLEAIIRTFDGVREAYVTIAPGTNQVYVLEDSSTPTTAGVTIVPDGNRTLSDGVVRAIRYTVSHSVERLKVEDVSIEDIYGNTYSDFDTTALTSQATALKLQHEEQARNDVRREVLNVLGPIYGEENVNVSVLCTVDVNHKIIDRTTYEQPDGSVMGGGLLIEDSLFVERIRGDGTPMGGTVGTDTNSDLNGYIPTYPDWAQDDDGSNTYLGEDSDRKHALDTTNTQEEVLVGGITDLRVVVSVNQDCKNSGAMTIDALRDSVASLAGIAGTEDVLDRVAVIIAPFDKGSDAIGNMGILGILGAENSWILYAAIGGLVLFVVLLVLILVLSARRRKKKRLEEQMTEEEEMAAAAIAAEAAALLAEAPPTGGADIMEVNTEKSMELRQEVRRFAQNNPEIAAQMVKAWLKGGDDTGG